MVCKSSILLAAIAALPFTEATVALGSLFSPDWNELYDGTNIALFSPPTSTEKAQSEIKWREANLLF